MEKTMVVSAARTAMGRAKKGSLADVRPEDMGAAVILEALKRAGDLDPKLVDDCIIGCAMPEAEQGMNLARETWFRAKLPNSVSCMTINRFCASGLEAIALGAFRIMSGMADVVVAGGIESMSLIPMGGNKIVPHPEMVEEFYPAYVSMGETAENVAKRYDISREEQDALGLRSNLLAVEGIDKGVFKEQIVPVQAYRYKPAGGKEFFQFDTDEGPRRDTSIEALSKLKPAFWKEGTVTAGNSSQMTDGAAAVVLMSKDKAKGLGLKPLGRFKGYTTVGCGPDEMGIGPSLAVPKLLAKVDLKLKEIDVIEMNEAFASQSVYCVKKLGLEGFLESRKLNPYGGAIALGHPLGATGAILSTKILYHMRDNNLKYGIVTMCVGGGMGAAGLFEHKD
jgi:acetyl-CoA acyltransferase